MISLYIHIPFCNHKCGYCSFHVMPLDTLQENTSGIIKNYLNALHRQIDVFSKSHNKIQVRSIYFGGGTPSTIGSQEMIKVIDHLAESYNLDYLEELSIEINPEPLDEMLDMIKTISNHYKHFHRVRFSIGIQSFDNEVLEDSGRKYNFQSCVHFLRKLVDIKMDHNVFNFDFIAFGKFNKNRKGDLQLRDPAKIQFLQNFVESGFADSFSLYTLELFEGSDRFNQQSLLYSHDTNGFGLKKYGSDDDVYEEFEILKQILLDAGYTRYEISNYSKAGKNSIHNRVYRAMGEWLGLGTGATSHLTKNNLGDIKSLLHIKSQSEDSIFSLHFTTTPSLKDFFDNNYINHKKTEILTEIDYLKEKFIMSLRTIEGYTYTPDIDKILVPNRKEKIHSYEQEGLCSDDGIRLQLSDSGMNVYNSIVSEIML